MHRIHKKTRSKNSNLKSGSGVLQQVNLHIKRIRENKLRKNLIITG